ncbi:MAG: DUF4238 domain-containing protein [Acidobacteriia bacterium]|nr:DUF4238 domain-containing protein [Terriglobia bacterium]
MTAPKLHHYVPQFYLRRFADTSGQLWLWDRHRDRVFHTSPNSIAAENNFYWHEELATLGHDPLIMEKQFSQLEGEVAMITQQWLGWLREIKTPEKIEIPDTNREIVAFYIALQFLRTADARDILSAFAEQKVYRKKVSDAEKRLLHLDMLWKGDGISKDLAERIKDSSWVFGLNTTATPFITSDNPVAFRKGDNAMWLKVGMFNEGTYSVFPMAPDIVMYCYPKEPPWDKLVRFDCCLSPVRFTQAMIESENTGQVFMASRFVISVQDGFDRERAFAKTIGTDLYAPYWRARGEQ